MTSPMNYLADLCDLANQDQLYAENSLHRLEQDLGQTRKAIDSLKNKQAKAIRRHEKYLHSLSHWSHLSTVTQYMSSTALIATGISMFGTASLPGGLLVAAGGTGLLHRALTDSRGYSFLAARWTSSAEQSQKIEEIAQTALSRIAFGCTLLGGGLGLYQGAFTALQQGGALLQKIGQTIGLAGSCLSQISIMRRGSISKDSCIAQAKVDTLSAEIREHENSLRYIPQDTHNLMQQNGDFVATILSCLDSR